MQNWQLLLVFMHPPDTCMCSLDSHCLRRRLTHLVNAISMEPVVRITRNFACTPLPDWPRNENVLVMVL